jgi:hypothetical protein
MMKKTVKKTHVGKRTMVEKKPSIAIDHSQSEKKAREAATIERRDAGKQRRSGADRREKDEPVEIERRVQQRREKVCRRRQIDPTTCERDYAPDEIEFMNALDEYKRSSGRMFPTCSEVLEVVKKLGYQKAGEPAAIDAPAETVAAAAV